MEEFRRENPPKSNISSRYEIDNRSRKCRSTVASFPSPPTFRFSVYKSGTTSSICRPLTTLGIKRAAWCNRPDYDSVHRRLSKHILGNVTASNTRMTGVSNDEGEFSGTHLEWATLIIQYQRFSVLPFRSFSIEIYVTADIVGYINMDDIMKLKSSFSLVQSYY